MKLSDAIRLGSMMHRQGFNTMYSFESFEGGGRMIATCALGAVNIAIVGEARAQVWTPDHWHREERFPVLNKWAKCPSCGRSDKVIQLIVHLNDGHRLTREEIADWLDFTGLESEPKEEEILSETV